jgi:uncharacterized membrane protein
MYKRVPTQILVVGFTNEEDAEKCLHKVAKAAKASEFPICTNAAIAKKGMDGRTKVKELGKPNMLKGLVGGTHVGGAAGASAGRAALSIIGPIGANTLGAFVGGAIGAPLGAVKGAVVGTVTGWSVDGMDKNKLNGIRDALEPGTSALVLVFAEVVVKKSAFETELEEYKTDSDAIAEAMFASISENLKQGNNSAHLLAVTEDGVVGMKVVVGEEVFSIAAVVLTEDAVAAAEMKVTPDGGEIHKVVATEDGIFAKGVVVSEDTALEYEFAALKE